MLARHEAVVDLGLDAGESYDDAVYAIERRYGVRITRTGRYVGGGNPEVIVAGDRDEVRRVLDDVWDMTRQNGARFTEDLIRRA